MANVVAPFGLSPLVNRDGDCQIFYKDVAAALGVGDPVIRLTNSSDPKGFQECGPHVADAAITGVVVAILPDFTRTTKHLASGDAGYVLVNVNPNTLYRVQDNGGATAITIAMIGEHIDTITHVACNSTTGRSKITLDTEAKATGNTWILMGLDQALGNAVGANASWIVKANLHTDVNASATNVSEI
jgi:hypothetical protein